MTASSAASIAGISGEERPRKADCVQDELLADGSMVLYHTCARKLLTLNPTAALVWECCDGAHSIPMIVVEVREVFPDTANIGADVLRLLHELLDATMLVDDGLPQDG